MRWGKGKVVGIKRNWGGVNVHLCTKIRVQDVLRAEIKVKVKKRELGKKSERERERGGINAVKRMEAETNKR